MNGGEPVGSAGKHNGLITAVGLDHSNSSKH